MNKRRVYVVGEAHPPALGLIAMGYLLEGSEDLEEILKFKRLAETDELRYWFLSLSILSLQPYDERNFSMVGYSVSRIKELAEKLAKNERNVEIKKKVENFLKKLSSFEKYYTMGFQMSKAVENIVKYQLNNSGIITIYLEGDRRVAHETRREIVEIAERYGARVIPLDEGDLNYEDFGKFLESLANLAREKKEGYVDAREITEGIRENIKKLQTGREDHWVEIIDKTAGNDEVSIAIVGIDHVIPYERSVSKYGIGNFVRKLEEKGFEVIIIDATQALKELKVELYSLNSDKF